MPNSIKEILSWYPALTSKQKANFLKLLEYGRIGGTGKLVMYPVDQGFEHGPARSFATNPAGYDPQYHAMLAAESGCNAHAAPLGALEAAFDITSEHKLPTILKVNNHDLLMPDSKDYRPALTSWVDDAVRLGAAAVGMTIFPGSVHAPETYQQARDLIADARKAGLIVVLWAYPRGSGLPSNDAETAIDVVSYGVHIAAQLGAHIIKCKASKNMIATEDSIKRKIYENLSTATLTDRTKLVLQAAFGGRRVVVFSGGEGGRSNEELLNEVKELKAGGSFGSIVGRNAFKRPKDEAIKLFHDIQDIYNS